MWHIFPVLLFGTDNKATLIINYKTVHVHNYKKYRINIIYEESVSDR